MAFDYYLGLIIGFALGFANTYFWGVVPYKRGNDEIKKTAQQALQLKNEEIDKLQNRLDRALDYIAKLKERAGYDGRDIDEWDN